MSDAATLEQESILAKMRRDNAETEKLIAESRKLLGEQLKLAAEQGRLLAEERKLGRDRLLAPWLAIIGLIGGLISIASAIAHWKGWD